MIMTIGISENSLFHGAFNDQKGVLLIAGIIIGIIIGISVYSYFSKRIVKNIDDGVMIISFLVATFCLIVSICFKEVDKSINVLSFFSSFVFSWLLTKKSSKEEFKERQQEIAKTLYRHIGDVRKATLVTQSRLNELNKKEGQISKNDIEGILDDVEIILQCIATNEGDWRDMVSESYLKKMKKYHDPEDEHEDNDTDKEVSQPVTDSFDELKSKAEMIKQSMRSGAS